MLVNFQAWEKRPNNEIYRVKVVSCSMREKKINESNFVVI